MPSMNMSLRIATEQDLDRALSTPPAALVDFMCRLDGDLLLLGVAGKVGVSMAVQAVRAIREAGVSKRVIGVARFSNPADRATLEAAGVETIACDLTDRAAVATLPRLPNVVFLVGRKFGTEGGEDLTWAMNTLPAVHAGDVFRESRIVAFSTGCVYPLVAHTTSGCTETTPPAPIGEYSQSCLARERLFQYCGRTFGTRVLLFRLNYAIALRYGVLHDIAKPIWEGRPVDNRVGYVNCLWQGDVTATAIRALDLCDASCPALNVTGPETAAVEDIAREMGALMGRPVTFAADAPGDLGYLSNASRMRSLFGEPTVPLSELIRLQADWTSHGGSSIGKPTHFEVNNGKF